MNNSTSYQALEGFVRDLAANAAESDYCAMIIASPKEDSGAQYTALTNIPEGSEQSFFKALCRSFEENPALHKFVGYAIQAVEKRMAAQGNAREK